MSASPGGTRGWALASQTGLKHKVVKKGVQKANQTLQRMQGAQFLLRGLALDSTSFSYILRFIPLIEVQVFSWGRQTVKELPRA
jgi:hypothetical protein